MSPLALRHEDPPADAVVIVRAGIMATDSVVRTASTSFENHGFYGVSVFAAIDMTVEELVARTPELPPRSLQAGPQLDCGCSPLGRLPAAADARLAALDIVLPDLEEPTLARLEGCFGPSFRTPDV